MQAKRILIIRMGALGDSLLLLPIIQVLREHYPNGYIELAGNTEYLILAEGYLQANKILSWDQPGLEQLYTPRGQLPSHWRDYFSRFDCILAYTNDPQGILAENLRKTGASLVLTHPPLPSPQQRHHIVKHLLRGCIPLGINLDQLPYPRTHLREKDKIAVKQFFKERDITLLPEQPIIAVHPGSGSPNKCWPVENFAQLFLELNSLLPLKICLIGGPADKQAFESLREMLKKLSPILCKELPLRTLAALLAHCHLYVGNDSGITHLAASLGIPTIALFGPTDPQVWSPLGEQVYVLTSSVFCSPCSQEDRNRCSDPTCLSSISPSQVLQTILSVPPLLNLTGKTLTAGK
jgi:ADP-heptose:LPS heptosyltransferase